jgi:hypothetical protein
VLDPNRLRIITGSWNKTDRHDVRDIATALWVYLVTGEFGIPTVYKPAVVIRELRKFFSAYTASLGCESSPRRALPGLDQKFPNPRG